ncbi:MAG: LamG-like jellyroll fold domain-containing protein [Akkermansiaceae bacterium]
MKNLITLAFFLSTFPIFGQELAPETFNHDVTYDGQTLTVNFTKYSVRGPLFDVVLQTTVDEDFVDHMHDTVVRTYIGSVVGQPGAMAAGMIRADGEVLARVTFADGTEWQDINGTVSLRGSAFTSLPSTVTITDGGAGSDLIAADVLFDIPFPQVTSSGGTAAAALEMTEYSMVCINASYIRDAAILNRVGLVIIRMDAAKDPYAGQTTTAEMLAEVKVQNQLFVNNSASPRGNHDLGLTASSQVGGGLANVGVVGNGFSSNGSDGNGDFAVVGRHELGHNWGSSHFEGGGAPEGATIMSGNGLGYFSSGELAKILSHRDSRMGYLDNLGNVAPAVPPRAANDVILAEVGSLPVTFAPLANDNDSNGDAISLLSFDASSALGNNVADTGDELTVTVSADFNSQADRVGYVVQDATLKTGEADILIKNYMEGDILGHWTFENSSSQALDSSSFINHASLVDGAFIEDGVLVLDGASDQGYSVLRKSVESNAITYSAMIYRDGTQNSFAGIVFQNDGGTSTGLNVGDNNELRYHWDSSTHWAYNSGLIIPDQTWTFVALVIEPGTATFYMNDGVNGMQTVARSSTHVIKLHRSYGIGRNPGSSSRVINGMMDDVRIINRALTASEIADLAVDGLEASDPQPSNGELTSDTEARLKWTSSDWSSQERLYFSDSYTALRDATSGSVEDLGIVSERTHDVTGLSVGHYYWRVDTIMVDGTVKKGSLWTFEIMPEDLIVSLSLDMEAEFTDGDLTKTQDTSGNDNHGILINAPDYYSGNCGDCCGFNVGTTSNQAISLGTPDDLNFGEGTDFTLALWVMPTSYGSDQVFISNKDWDSGSNPGYILGTNSNLRIEWNIGDGTNRNDYDGSADQLAINDWNHVAVSHDRSAEARIYLNGEFVDSKTISSIADIDSGLPTQLATDGESDYDFEGYLDEIKIFSRALSDAEIKTLHRESTTYYKWASNYYSGLDLADTTISAPESDPDADGVPNLLNFAFQTNPQSPDISQFPSIAAGGKAFSFYRMKDGSGGESNNYQVGGINYTVEASTTLEANSWSQDSTLWEEDTAPVDGANNTELISIRPVDESADKMFFRIKVSSD